MGNRNICEVLPGGHVFLTRSKCVPLTLCAQVLQHKKIDMSEGEMGAFAKSCLEAMSFLHGLGRIHRDIKSDNILINTRGEVKIADFGFCVQLTEEKSTRHSMVCRLKNLVS